MVVNLWVGLLTFCATTHAAALNPLHASRSLASPSFDFDVLIVGCGVGGHGAALHAVANGLKTAILTAGDVGGTCVNRGCIPSKALLSSAGVVHSLTDRSHLEKLGVRISGEVQFHRQSIADHANNLASTLRQDLEKSLLKHGVEVFHETGTVVKENEVVLHPSGRRLTARDVILSPGSTPAIPPSIPIDGELIFTSDTAVQLRQVPRWIAIIGMGYIGLEFADIYTSLGADVTMIDVASTPFASFDSDIAKQIERLIVKPRNIDTRAGYVVHHVTPGQPKKKPVVLHLRPVDAVENSSQEVILEVDSVLVATGRRGRAETLGLENLGVELTAGNFVPVNDKFQVIHGNSTRGVFSHLYCIGDANGKIMLAHAASSQGISVVDTILGRSRGVFKMENVPAACFTHPEIAFVGKSEAAAREEGRLENFELGKSTSQYRANSKALAEEESGGMLKLLYRKDSGRILGAHVIGEHASDLIQQVANAMAMNATVETLSYVVHSHPTLSEVLLSAYKTSSGLLAY